MSTCESAFDELAAWGSQTTEPAADTFQRYEMDKTAPSAAQGALDIRSAPAAPPSAWNSPADCRPSATRRRWIVVPDGIFTSSAQQEAAQAGRERGYAGSRQGALAIVETLHDARGCGYRRGWSIEGCTGPEALELLQNELRRRL